ncbi:MAG: ZIP family metal transporter [Candidatus Omnitrophica bacterium]|nr:ZIP family metal transporter [Candidatus Omnitrophota bacterium]
MVLVWIISSTLLVCIISLIGIFTLAVKEELLKKLLSGLIGLSGGALIGGAFLHLLPEALEESPAEPVFYSLVFGILLFFFMERYFYWRHCHDSVCDIHAYSYLNLFGDAFHNFVDGVAIAVSFVASVEVGIVTTLAIILHEIPQELGDFGVLVYGGFSKKKALTYNFISALFAIVGATAGFFLTDLAKGSSVFILPLTAGGFIYIGASDLIPEIHKQANQTRSSRALIAFLLGILFMALAKYLMPH